MRSKDYIFSENWADVSFCLNKQVWDASNVYLNLSRGKSVETIEVNRGKPKDMQWYVESLH